MSYTSFRYINGTKDDIVLTSADTNFEVRNHPKNSAPGAKYYIRNVSVDLPNHNVNFNFKLNVSREQEIIGMLSPLSNDSSRFYYNLKGSNYPVEGTLNFKGNVT